MAYEIETLKLLMWRLLREHKQALNELTKLPEGRLHQEKHGDRTYYYHVLGKGQAKIRKGITKDWNLIYRLARKEYLLAAMKRQEQGIEGMNGISDKMNLGAWQEAAEVVCEKYPTLPPEVFLLGDRYQPHPASKSTMFLKGTIHRTQGGVLVRSKSELVIAEMLESIKIPYQYEEEIHYGGYQFCPDFTVVRPRDGKVIFWEHFGMTYDREYLKKMDLKLDRYRNMEIRPWDNLMISYDKEDGSLDVGLIRALVEGWLK